MGLDVGAVEAWCAAHVPGLRGPFTVEVIRGGQSNPTYALESPSGSFILRRKPMGKLLKSAHAVDREFRVMQALAQTEVPVPQLLHLSADSSPLGPQFLVMEMVQGRIFWDPALPDLSKSERAAVYATMNATLARLHDVAPGAVGLDT